jgi:hypothetical protein
MRYSSSRPGLSYNLLCARPQYNYPLAGLRKRYSSSKPGLSYKYLCAGLDFRYSSPEPGFQKERVKGVVAKLVRLRDEATTTALEVAAGGKLYQVVVDSEQTAKALLARGQLRSRVTIIPLNKVRSCSRWRCSQTYKGAQPSQAEKHDEGLVKGDCKKCSFKPMRQDPICSATSWSCYANIESCLCVSRSVCHILLE